MNFVASGVCALLGVSLSVQPRVPRVDASNLAMAMVSFFEVRGIICIYIYIKERWNGMEYNSSHIMCYSCYCFYRAMLTFRSVLCLCLCFH